MELFGHFSCKSPVKTHEISTPFINLQLKWGFPNFPSFPSFRFGSIAQNDVFVFVWKSLFRLVLHYFPVFPAFPAFPSNRPSPRWSAETNLTYSFTCAPTCVEFLIQVLPRIGMLFRVGISYSRVSLHITSWSCESETQIWQHMFVNEPRVARTWRKNAFCFSFVCRYDIRRCTSLRWLASFNEVKNVVNNAC